MGKIKKEEKQKKVAILSIDGGGIRGVIPGVILNHLEKELRQISKKPDAKLVDFFDFVAGTSTGGILACLYLFPDGDSKRPKHSTDEALELYLKNGDKIFHAHKWDLLAKFDGLMKEKYSIKHIEALMSDYFENKTLSKLVKPCLITSYEMTSRKAHFFRSIDAKNGIDDFYVRDVARATSAAPTYFEPALIKSMNGQEFALIDGGVFANNPALCAYAEARRTEFSKCGLKIKNPGAKDMMIVSVGTGTIRQPYHYDEFKNAGQLKWLNPIIDILMSGNAETVDYQLTQIFDTLEQENKKYYYRLEPQLREASEEMDNACEENLENLKQAGLWFVGKHKSRMTEIAKELVANSDFV
jgi:uncharacterized protein